MLVLIVIAEWTPLSIPIPRWLTGNLTFLVVAFGLILAVMGSMAWYRDSHMQPDVNEGLAAMARGIVILFSRARQVFG